MTKINQAAFSDYLCPKCRGNKADVREVTLNKSRVFGLFPCKDTRYVEVTCMLCGYTEFYNRALYVASQAEVRIAEKNALPLPEEKVKAR